MILMLFYIQEDARIQGHRKFSLDMHLNYLGAMSPKHRMLPGFLHPEILPGRTAVANGLDPCRTGMAGNILFFTGGTRC